MKPITAFLLGLGIGALAYHLLRKPCQKVAQVPKPAPPPKETQAKEPPRSRFGGGKIGTPLTDEYYDRNWQKVVTTMQRQNMEITQADRDLFAQDKAKGLLALQDKSRGFIQDNGRIRRLSTPPNKQ